MDTSYRVLVLLIVIAITTLVALNINSEEVLINKNNCCRIVIQRLPDHTAVVHYISNTKEENFDMYLEVEYPSEEYTREEEIEFEIEYAVSEMKDLCNQHH